MPQSGQFDQKSNAGRDDVTEASALTHSVADGAWQGAAARSRCRTNSRRGFTDPEQRSYAPVDSVGRAFKVLRAVNKLGVASVNEIFEETRVPKSTIVRMLETLMHEGYVARDNMCGGYHVTCRTHELTAGRDGIAQMIEVARPHALELTASTKCPIGIGVLDGDAIAVRYWTGAVSPLAHTNTVLGQRADLLHSAMGRAFMAFCPPEQMRAHVARMRATPELQFGAAEERRLHALLAGIRKDGYAMRDPATKPFCTITLATAIKIGDAVHGLISLSLFKSAIERRDLAEKIVGPLQQTTAAIGRALALVRDDGRARATTGVEPGF